ncbi:MAG: phenylalanine--tRNA ligase subunit beta [Opitutales bacterium]
MNLSLNWLKRYLPDLAATPEELEHVLPMIGLEVDAVRTVGLPPIDNLVVGEVISREQHPNADRLGVCQVDAGEGAPRQIVCGATNYKVGDRVPVALPGAVLPGDFKIKKSKLRGVESAGMMCSARELGLGEDHAGLLILEDRPEVGTPLNDIYKDTDTVFETEVTANRGDYLSHRGVARELAAWFDLSFVEAQARVEAACSETPDTDSLIDGLRLQTPGCPYYRAWSVRGVRVGPSPQWLRTDLERVGLRPINNVVDITNWVLMDLGQPLHAFDAKKIGGSEIVVRQAGEGERITTLDSKARTLSPEMMVIADAQKPLVIAGVMGSQDAEVDDSTTDVVLEIAWFEPGSIRSTARKLALASDSSQRFSRNVDPQLAELAGRKAIDLILELAGGEVVGPEVVVGEPPRGDTTVEVTGDYIRSVSGFPVQDGAIADIFRRLHFGVVERGEGRWAVTVPSAKWEVTRPVDLAEEVIRIYGAERIPSQPVRSVGLEREDAPVARFNEAASAYLTGQGFVECVHYTLRAGSETADLFGELQAPLLALAEPLTSEQSHLRPSLLPGLLDALALNLNNGNDVRRLFECGRVFRAHAGEVFELASVGFVLLQAPAVRTWQTPPPAGFFSAKALAAELFALGGVKLEDSCIQALDTSPVSQPGHGAMAYDWPKQGYGGWFGLCSFELLKRWDIDRPVLFGEVAFLPEKLAAQLTTQQAPFAPFSSFPPSTRDVALVVDQALPAESVRRTVAHAAQASCGDAFNLEGVSVFDVFSGKGLPEGKKSLAFGITFRSDERTLKEDEIAAAFDQTLQRLQAEPGYAVRR